MKYKLIDSRDTYERTVRNTECVKVLRGARIKGMEAKSSKEKLEYTKEGFT